MNKEKRLRLIAIIGSLILFLVVIVLTHDSFDDLESKNTIMVGLSFLQFGILVYTWGFTAKRSKEV